MISVKGLSVAYGRKIVLANIFLHLEEGHLYGIFGQNGAGKSTLFKAILGLLEPSSGTISIRGRAVSSQRKNMVYIPQKGEIDWQFPATVYDVVMMGRYPHKKIWQRLNKTDHLMAEQALDDMGIAHLKKRQIGELSGGQQQRVFLARALCQEADIFLMDEPFVGVDVVTEEKIVNQLQQLRDAGKTMLIIHHDLSKVRGYFDRLILLNQHLVAEGPVEEVFTDENIAKAYGGQLTLLQKTQEF